MQLVCVSHDRPSLFRHFGNRGLIQRTDVARQVGRQTSAHLHRSRTPFLQRRVIQVGIGIGIQDFMTEGRRHRCIHCDALDCSLLDASEQRFQPVHIHGLCEAVANGFLDQRMIRGGQIGRSAWMVVLARRRCREHGGQQILRAHALDLRGHPLPVGKPEQGQRARGIPAPAAHKHRCSQDGLCQHLTHGL